ncbi:Rhodanese-related sulfurtransferase [Halorhabdus sp. SVX81]|uniref:sulfurtransferase n=1 Tax=Halorhabdus sp. SVX81 TaxID=2978283 RepID=UPI0023DA600D|nr:rhodanese-like domain-containing protein [Halorhabdus sp. SVX81]WEL18832.1 Rhodanese-related sulfurtransferase [Halorhabdus sp. SVX81]
MTDIVATDWLADRLSDVRLVDVRDAWEYEGIGHFPGAVSIPFGSFRASEGDDGMLPGEDVFANLLSDAGIAPEDDIVAYDDTHGVFAARFLVTAELYGHDPDRLHLLDGDFSAWQRDHPTTDEVPDVTPTEYKVDRPAESTLVGREAVAAAIDTDAVIVDTRERWEYEEGHIPGAVQLDWRDLVDDETRGIKPREEIEAILEPKGITPDSRIVLYCNTARRISHTYVVLQHLGYGNLAFYEGSLTEWEAAGEPIETVE